MTYKPVKFELNGLSYTIKTLRVDIETGEIINKKDAENKDKYILVNTQKQIVQNGITKRTIEFTKRYRRQPQQRLF